MLKEVLASKAAKLVAACVCPIAAGTLALKVPPVRSAIHKATAPERKAAAKPQIKAPAKKPALTEEDKPIAIAMAPLCAEPVLLPPEEPLTPVFEPRLREAPMSLVLSIERPPAPSNCGPSRFELTRPSAGGVPEPATWAQMVAGFGLLGGMLRAGRRRRNRALAG